MLVLKNNLKKFASLVLLANLALTPASAHSCETQLFTATLNNELTIGDVVENLADECGLSLIIKDIEAKKKMADKLYFVKVNNASLDEFLETVLTENDIAYVVEDNKLKISYLTTRTFKLDYLAGDRKGKSNAHVTLIQTMDHLQEQEEKEVGLTVLRLVSLLRVQTILNSGQPLKKRYTL